MLFNDFIKSLVGKGRIVNTSTLGLGPGPSNGSPKPGFLGDIHEWSYGHPSKPLLKPFFLLYHTKIFKNYTISYNNLLKIENNLI